MEEASSESSRKMQDKEETTSEVSCTAVEGVPVNPEGEGHREQAQAKSSKRERVAPGEEGEEVKSPKRKVVLVESEETQDYVRVSLDLSREEAEEISFVPSAISVPQKPMFWCDNRCTEKALSFWQFASVAVEEGVPRGNLCQQCYNKILVAKGDKPLWYAVVEKKAHRGMLWRMLGKTSTYEECGSISLVRDRKRRSFKRMPKKKSRKGYKANGNVNRRQGILGTSEVL